jgi:hypothetical protein
LRCTIGLVAVGTLHSSSCFRISFMNNAVSLYCILIE